MVGLDGEKMSKSKGNLVFVSKLLKEGIDPMTLRHALLSERYSEDRMWSQKLYNNQKNVLFGYVLRYLELNVHRLMGSYNLLPKALQMI
jgi:cysteinyl-tRNA synthetase